MRVPSSTRARRFTPNLRIAFMAVMAACCLLFTADVARAQTEDVAIRWKRSGTLMLALSAASAGTATGLLLTQEPRSFGHGLGIGHAMLASGYALDGTLRLINMGRVRKNNRPVVAGRVSVMGPVNVVLNGLVTGMGVLLLALSPRADDRGIGLVFTAHGAWLTTFSLVQWLRGRRGRTWMASSADGFHF